jgi:flagellar biosynthesis/type III secretory pathway protein FliH
MPLSNIIRHIDPSRIRLRPFALAEAGANAHPPGDAAALAAKVVRNHEGSRLPVYIFPSVEGETTAADNPDAPLSVVPDQETSIVLADSREPQPSTLALGALPSSPPEHETLLHDAYAQAERCLSAARERAMAMEAEGYRAGFQQGEEAARTAVQTECATLFASLQHAAADCVRLRHDILWQAEEDIVSLAFLLARKVIQYEAQWHGEILASTLHRALAHVVDRDHVVIRVNPADLKRALHLKEGLLHSVDGLRHLTIEGDTTVGPGGCLVESTFGEIDARLESQFEELEQRFREHYSLKSEATVS